MADSDLQKRLEHLGRRLVEDIERWEQNTRDTRRETLTNLTEHLGQKLVEVVETERARQLARHESKRETKRQRRARQREERRAKQRQESSTLVGVVQLVAAVAFVALAVLRPELWWVVFVALGLGVGGARQLSLASEQRRLERSAREPGPRQSAVDAQAHEVDLLCDQLLVDLKGAPEAVRQFVQAPERTIATLRATARALDDRRRQLLAERPGERLAALDGQAADLRARRDGAGDETTRRRFDDALTSVAAQRVALGQLKTAAERVDGEYTSLLVSLQELRTRVSVAKAAGTDVQLAGLEQSVQRLNAELEAIGEALSSVAHDGLQPVAPIEGADDGPRAPAGVRTKA